MTECKTITFRPTPEAERQIEALMKAWGCKRSQAIMRAIAVASMPQIAADNDQGAAGVAKARLKQDLREGWRSGVADPAKLVAFQERTGMTKWGKKRG